MAEVMVGDRVRDPVSGLVGIVQSRTQWLYGCVRLGIQPIGSKDGKPFETFIVDEPQVEVIAENGEEPAEPRHGGRDDAAALRRD